MAYYGCSGLGHCRHLDTRYIVVRLLMQKIQWCFICTYPTCLRSPKGMSLRSPLKSSWYFPLALTTHRGIFFFYITLTPVGGSFVGTWKGDQQTFPFLPLPPPQKKTGVSRASYYYAPIQIKPNRVKALSLCGVIVQ